MKYRDRTTGEVYTLFQLQQKFSNVSFPVTWDSTTYDFANVDIVTETPQPTPHITNRIEYGGVTLVDGQWKEVWNEVPKYDDPTEQSAWETECVATQWNNIRGERDRLISMTDYTQMPDCPITTESKANFLAYRQSLRDITNQTDPYNIVWPEPPIYEKE
jgi:Phage tail assembly chaperone protein